jgi:hypothetical protein
MSAVRTRPGRGELPGEHFIHADAREPSNTEGERRTWTPKSGLAEAQRLRKRAPAAAAYAQEANGRADVLLLVIG